MNIARLLNDIEHLPPEAQRQIENFVAFIKTRYPPATITKLSEEEFVGMWSNPPQIQDSMQWVQNSQESEWSKGDV